MKDTLDNRTIFRKGSITYYYASLFFRGQVKKDVFALYAYVRIVDDLVDNSSPNMNKIDSLWELTQKALKGKKVQNKVVSGFAELANRKKFDSEWIEAFWLSMRQDITKKQYHNFKELEDYMYGSAEVIGLMMARILDLPKESYKYAQLQGKAMQYVNFIRDVKEDLELGRNYLGYETKIINDEAAWSNEIRTHISRYREIQKKAKLGYKMIPKKYLVPIKTAAEMYCWTADQIFKNPMLVWETKLKPKSHQVVVRAVANYFSI